MGVHSPKADLLESVLDRGLASAEFQDLSLAGLGGGEARASGPSGVRALMIAVLVDGIRCYLGSDVRAAAEADSWIRSHRHRGPFSFVAVCEALELDPEAARAAVVQMKDAKRSPSGVPRVRNNVRRPERVRPRKYDASGSTPRRGRRRPRVLVEVARVLGLPGG